MSRWEVWAGVTRFYHGQWLAGPAEDAEPGQWCTPFPTWREAFDYADAMARSDA